MVEARSRGDGVTSQRRTSRCCSVSSSRLPTTWISASGRSCPTFLIDLGSRLDSSPYCMRQAQQTEKDQIDCHKTMRIHMHAVSDAKGSRFSLIDIVKPSIQSLEIVEGLHMRCR